MIAVIRPRRPRPPAVTIIGGTVVLGAVAPAAVDPGRLGGGGVGATGAIAVKASEYKFDPATITAMPGSATFVLTNTGATEHEL